ncbi:Flp pilus assembly protein CpaB [Roseomonas chloroacetimidivorans]|jgi:pilus assembly protein CpaB|uniref:Flp pilus assembly protein CpaB n=1 Tax=Roseomonas chloroacetimidivorans TaxID=1766656 RepID=UPI003C71533A
MMDVRQVSYILGTALLVAGATLALRPAPVPAPAAPIMAVAPAVPERPAGQRVAVAARDIPRGTSLDAGVISFVTMERVPAEGTSSTAAPLLGRVAKERIAAGQILLPGMLTPTKAGAGLAPLVPAGTRAVTLRVADDTGIGYLIRPGDRVDVMVTTRSGTEGSQQLPDLSRLVVQDLQVLAVGDGLEADANAPAGARREPQRTVTVAASPEELLLLGLSRADGGYMFALRNPEDREGLELPPTLRSTLLGNAPDAVPAPAPFVERTAPSPRPASVRTGPEIIRGAVGANR